MGSFDVLIDPATGDLPPVTSFVTGAELVTQRARVRLATFLGDWVLDQTVGIDFVGIRQQKPPDLPAINAVILAELAGTPGVLRVESIDTTFDPVTRIIKTTGTAVVQDGDPVDQLAAAFVVVFGVNVTPVVVAFYSSGPIAV